jgi:polyribonucleotide nucleotidyltransferase
MTDRITGISYDKFYLHYTMAPFSVGEAKGYRGVGRREIGHGNLAERALKKVMPDLATFPYTVRVACEVLESNGSSSMGSVCSGSMALMDAGVPLRAPVAGVAMGLIKEGDNFKILTDILGDEDHLGDMDFKVAGTEKGITAIQMDIKITGITSEIMKQAMAQAKSGRLHILGEMAKTISKPRASFKQGVPQIKMTKIAPDKIGALIGPGGKNIKGIQEGFQVSIEVDEDGTVKVLGSDVKVLDEVVALIELQLTGPKPGSEYTGKVVTVKEYGAFVDIAPGISGLVHVSEIADERVQDVNQYLKEGEEVKVKVLEVDRFGKIRLSIKAVAPIAKKG